MPSCVVSGTLGKYAAPRRALGATLTSPQAWWSGLRLETVNSKAAPAARLMARFRRMGFLLLLGTHCPRSKTGGPVCQRPAHLPWPPSLKRGGVDGAACPRDLASAGVV